MIEVVSIRKGSACVWLSEEQLHKIQTACCAIGMDKYLDGKASEAVELLDIAQSCNDIIEEITYEEGYC